MVDPAHTSAFTTALPGQFSRVNSVVCPRGTQEQMCSQELQEGTVNKRASCVVTKGTDGDGKVLERSRVVDTGSDTSPHRNMH